MFKASLPHFRGSYMSPFFLTFRKMLEPSFSAKVHFRLLWKITPSNLNSSTTSRSEIPSAESLGIKSYFLPVLNMATLVLSVFNFMSFPLQYWTTLSSWVCMLFSVSGRTCLVLSWYASGRGWFRSGLGIRDNLCVNEISIRQFHKIILVQVG